MDTDQSPDGTTGRRARTAAGVLPALTVSVAVAAASWTASPVWAASAAPGVPGSAPTAAAPRTFVAVTAGTGTPPRLATYDTVTGRRLRLLTAAQPGGGPSDPVLDDAGTTVVFASGGGSCASDLRTVRADGSAPPRLLARGVDGPLLSPALAPRDGRVAYVQEHCDGTPPTLEVRAVPATGPATGPGVVRYQGSPGELVLAPRWSRHGVLSFLTRSGPRPGLHTVSAAPGGPLQTVPAVAGCSWSSATWYAQGTRDLLLASMQCGTTGRWRVLDQHLATVRVLNPPPGQRGAQTVSVDATGSWALYQENGAGLPGRTWRWQFASGDAPQLVTRGPSSPTWR